MNEARNVFRKNNTLFMKCVLITSAFSFLIQIFYGIPKAINREDQNRDLVAYYLAGKRLVEEQPLYTKPPGGPHNPTKEEPRYLYPPFFASALKPFFPMPFICFAKIWTAVLIASYFSYGCILSYLACGRLTFYNFLIANQLLTLFPGAWRAVSLGQIDPVIWTLFGMGLISNRARGILFLVITLIKPHNLWATIIVAVRGKKIQLLSMTFAVIILTLFSCFSLGFDNFYLSCIDWFRFVPASLGQGSWLADNVSLSFLFVRALSWTGFINPEETSLPIAIVAYLKFTAFAVPPATSYIFRKKEPSLHYSRLAVVSILFAPICWSTYLPILLVLFASEFRNMENYFKLMPAGFED